MALFATAGVCCFCAPSGQPPACLFPPPILPPLSCRAWRVAWFCIRLALCSLIFALTCCFAVQSGRPQRVPTATVPRPSTTLTATATDVRFLVPLACFASWPFVCLAVSPFLFRGAATLRFSLLSRMASVAVGPLPFPSLLPHLTLPAHSFPCSLIAVNQTLLVHLTSRELLERTITPT